MRRHAFGVMGTMASVAVAGDVPESVAAAGLAACEASLREDEQRFSHYRADSDIERWLAGQRSTPDAVADIDQVIRACLDLQVESDCVFTAVDPGTGRIDTAGFVKGHAIGRAAARMRAVGLRDFSLGVGGDTWSSGRPAPDRPWRVAVADPTRPRGVSAIVAASDLAVATSGSAQRGQHIWRDGGPATPGIRSFTVVGPDVALADAYATIGFALGAEAGMAWVTAHDGYAALVVRSDGTVVSEAALVSAA